MKKSKKILKPEELLGYFDEPEDNGEFVLDLKEAREERAEKIMNKGVFPKFTQFFLKPRKKK